MSLSRRWAGAAALCLLCLLPFLGLRSAAGGEGRSDSAGLASPSLAEAPGTRLIPPVAADTLSGKPVRLPADLRGRNGVLVLGFGKDARTQVRDWGKRLATDFYDSPSVLYYEMPVLAGVPRLLRGVVLRSIAAEVSERGKAHFVPISGNETRWRELAGYGDPNIAYVLVVDGSGTVRWVTSGTLTEAAYAALRQHLAPAAQ